MNAVVIGVITMLALSAARMNVVLSVFTGAMVAGWAGGLNSDGQHDHIRDTVRPTFLHYNLPMIAFGGAAAMVL